MASQVQNAQIVAIVECSRTILTRLPLPLQRNTRSHFFPFQIEMNRTDQSMPFPHVGLFSKYMRSLNSIFACTGVLSNAFLLIVLLRIGRRRCATYFLLMLMAVCDFIYCINYASMWLTNDYYLNIVNHQILCPLSFFLIPFSLTGSTLLLLICLLHLVTNYRRRYDTVLGQLGGRLSIVFVIAFITIRSVLGSTSVVLMIDPAEPSNRYCTIANEVPPLVVQVQNINHIFAEVTDILVYISWSALLLIHVGSSLSRWKRSRTNSLQTHGKSVRLVSFLSDRKENSSDALSTRIQSINYEINKNKRKHRDASSIILCICLMSILLYLPIMSYKLIAMDGHLRDKTFLSERQVVFLQDIQQAAHLLCLAIRFVPYLIFDKRIHAWIHRVMGVKIRRKTPQTTPRGHGQRYRCRCHCSRRQSSLELNPVQSEQNAQSC